MSVIVIGSSGTIGSAVIEELEKNHKVIKVGRHKGDLICDITSEKSMSLSQ